MQCFCQKFANTKNLLSNQSHPARIDLKAHKLHFNIDKTHCQYHIHWFEHWVQNMKMSVLFVSCHESIFEWICCPEMNLNFWQILRGWHKNTHVPPSPLHEKWNQGIKMIEMRLGYEWTHSHSRQVKCRGTCLTPPQRYFSQRRNLRQWFPKRGDQQSGKTKRV